MKAFHLTAVSAAMLMALAAGPAVAQHPTIAPNYSAPPHQGHMQGHGHGRFPRGFFVYPEYVPVYVQNDADDDGYAAPPPAAPPPPPAAPREPYVIGHSYSSLPGGCLKLIQDGASYYGCSGQWYRQVADAQYKAVPQP